MPNSTVEIEGEGPQQNEASDRDNVLSAGYLRFLWVLLGSIIFVRVFLMVVMPFTDTTEARYAEIARKMVETGNWITPLFDYGVPFWGKPPLHTWLSAGGMQFLGINEFAARLPIFLTGLIVLFLIWRWVYQIAGRNTSLLTIVVLSSMALFFGASAYVMTDMPMTLGCVMVMIGFWNTTQRPEAGRIWGFVIFVGFAVGMLAKGPVAVVICGIPITAWLLVSRNWGSLRHIPWITGTALFAVLTIPWYIAAEIATPGFLNYFIIGEHYERFVVPGWSGDLYGTGHSQPKGMIWLLWPGTLLPWTIALLPLLAKPRKLVRSFTGSSNLKFYLLMWVISPMILFTPASNILEAYVLPGLPAAAILLVLLYRQETSVSVNTFRKLSFGFLAFTSIAFFAVVASIMWLTPEKLDYRSQKRLIAASTKFSPEAELYYFTGRIFSANFYSDGRALFIDSSEDLYAIIQSEAAANIVIKRDAVDQLSDIEIGKLIELGRFDRYILYTSSKEISPNK